MKVNLRAILASTVVASMAIANTVPAFAAEVLIYSNEVEEVNANEMILDFDDTGGDITIQFGDALGETFLWDNTDTRFELSDDLLVDGVDYAADAEGATYVNVNQTITESIDALDDALGGLADGGDQLYTEDNFVTDSESFTDSIDALDINLQDAFDDIGNQTYTADNVVTDGESVTASIDALDQAVGGVGNRTYTNDNVVTDGETLTASVDALDTQFGDLNITDDGASFVLQGLDNANITAMLNAINTGVGNRTYTEDNFVTDGETLTSSVDALDTNLQDAFDDIGNQTYTADNVVTDGESITASIDALDQAVGSVGNRIYTEDNFVTDGETLTSSVDALDTNLQDAFDDIGNQTYTADNVVTDGESITASIDALDQAVGGVGNRTYTNDNVVTDGETLTASVDALDTQFGDLNITDDGASFVLQGLDNANMTAMLNAVNTGVGNRTYTADNVVTDGESITDSIDALDQAMGPASRYFEVTMNDLTVITDGTNNRANLYNDYDEAADHEYYFLKSRQAAKQDLDLKFKVLVPNDFVSFPNDGNDLSFFYRNQNGADNTDSSIDISIADEDGDVGYSTTNLFNAGWTELAENLDDAGASFDPVPGEYVYVTVKAAGSRDGSFQMPYIGEIKFNYENQ